MPENNRLFFVDLDCTLGYMEGWEYRGDPLVASEKTLATYQGHLGNSTGPHRDYLQARMERQGRLVERLRTSTSFEINEQRYTAIARPDARAFLLALAEHGTVHLLTAAHPLYAKRALVAMGLYHLIDTIYSLKSTREASGRVTPLNPNKHTWILIEDLPPTASGPKMKCEWIDSDCNAEEYTFQVPGWTGDGAADDLTSALPEILRRVGVTPETKTGETPTPPPAEKR